MSEVDQSFQHPSIVGAKGSNSFLRLIEAQREYLAGKESVRALGVLRHWPDDAASAVCGVGDLSGGMIDADEVEARLIEAQRVFWRMEGSGRAWATDGPWFLSRNRDAGDYWIARMGQLEIGESLERAGFDPRPDRSMISRAEEAGRWLALIEHRDGGQATIDLRRLVIAVIAQLAASGRRPDWLAVGGAAWSGSVDRKRMAYGRAMDRLAVRVSRLGGGFRGDVTVENGGIDRV